MSRRALILAGLLLLAGPLSGCWVIDELDAGKDLMDKHTPKSAAEEEPEGAAVKPAAAGDKDAIDTYFRGEEEDGTTKSFAPGAVSEGIVACKLGGSVQFMKREQCAARGGRAG
jgi:hypothetical protein